MGSMMLYDMPTTATGKVADELTQTGIGNAVWGPLNLRGGFSDQSEFHDMLASWALRHKIN